MYFNNLCRIALVLVVGVLPYIFGGHHGVVDDEIWHHVTKVLSDHEGRGKVLLSHPEPAHLVDAFTKVYSHDPHLDNYHHYAHGDDHHYHIPDPHHEEYHGHPPALLKVPVPVPLPVIRFGPPPHLPHPLYHYRK